MTTHKLTPAQSNTLDVWVTTVGARPAGIYEVFGARNNVDNGHRRNCEALIRAGALKLVDRDPSRVLAPRYRAVTEAKE